MVKIKSTKQFSFKPSELTISIEDLEKLAHMGDDMPSYKEFLEGELHKLENIASIQGGYVIVNSQIQQDSIGVGGVTFNTGREISRYFKNISQSALFICSAGSEISEVSKKLNLNGELLESYLIDVLGSVIAEKAMDKIQETLRLEMETKGLKITNRYSPGYCDWNVSEQKQLFTFFPKNFCNVTLSNSCLMHPVKTVSGIIGIGKQVKFNKHICQACNSINCLYRNANNR